MRLLPLLFALLATACSTTTDLPPFDQHMLDAQEARADGQQQLAITEYRAALRYQPASAEAHNNLGSVLFDTGQTDAAILEFQRALLLDDRLAAAHNNMGSALLSKGQAAEAVGYFRRSVALNPEMSIARFNLCLGLETLGQYAAALLECQLTSVRDPSRPGVEEAIQRLQGRLDEIQ